MRNVILILTDQQHYRTLGVHGVPEARTPNLDRLASLGVDFQNHIVTNPVCSPSRGSIMTGLYPSEHGLWGNGCRLPEHVPTLAQAMRAAGFQTAHFGKLHLVPIVNRTEKHPSYGFETCEVAEGDQQLLDDEYFRWLRTTDPDLFIAYVTEMYEKGHVNGYKSLMPEEKHLSTWVTRRACDWLRHRRRKDQPFFLSVGYFDPHHAFNPCEPYASMYDSIEVTPPVGREGSHETRPVQYQQRSNSLKRTMADQAKVQAILRAYHAMMAHVDKCVGDLLTAVSEQGLDQETLVVFSSDHGELLCNHGLLWKGPLLLDDVLRVPLIVSIPGGGIEPLATAELSSAVDLMATIQAAAGVEQPIRGSGRPLLDAQLRPFPEGPREYALCEWEQPGNGLTSSLRCIRTKTHKLVQYAGGQAGELYDLAKDPSEFENLYNAPGLEKVQEDLYRKLASHYMHYRPHVRFEGAW
jgi:arylsulfatase A-like enzyme